MKTQYEITGIIRDGDRIRLILKLLEQSSDENPFELMARDPNVYVTYLKKQQLDAKRDQNPESITVSIEQGKRDNLGLGHIIEIEVSRAIIPIDQNNPVPINNAANQNDYSPQKKAIDQNGSIAYG